MVGLEFNSVWVADCLMVCGWLCLSECLPLFVCLIVLFMLFAGKVCYGIAIVWILIDVCLFGFW